MELIVFMVMSALIISEGNVVLGKSASLLTRNDTLSLEIFFKQSMFRVALARVHI